MTDIDAIEARHYERAESRSGSQAKNDLPRYFCAEEHQEWPCDTRQVLDALRAAEAREARLREALPATSRRVLMQPERQYLDAMEEQFSILVGSLRDEHLREHAQIGLDAARAALAEPEAEHSVRCLHHDPAGNPAHIPGCALAEPETER